MLLTAHDRQEPPLRERLLPRPGQVDGPAVPRRPPQLVSPVPRVTACERRGVPYTAAAAAHPAAALLRRRLLHGSMLTAVYGVNELVVGVPPRVLEQFPAHARNASVYGRLVSATTVVAVDVELTYSDEVRSLPCS